MNEPPFAFVPTIFDMTQCFRLTCLLTLSLLLLDSRANGQTLTWDPDSNTVNDGGAGTWDTTTGNWINATPWVNGSNAIFGSGTYQVDLTNAGVTVGDLSFGGGGTLELRGSSPNGTAGDTITINSGGATWNTGGGEIAFFNDGNDSNTRLSMTVGDTLTVQGGGTFDTGQNPQTNGNGDWQVGGATLDATGVNFVRGSVQTIGQLGTVRMAADSTYVHERNANQTYTNDWELSGSGNVTFDNRFTRNSVLAGVVSGTGGITVANRGDTPNAGFFELRNINNTFSGGVLVDGDASASMLIIRTGDGALGAVPGAFDADNISLKDGGILKLIGIDVNANRGITLTNGGAIDSNGTSTLNSGITGTGGLTIGYVGGTGDTLNLQAASDYTGGTTIYEGNVVLGIDEALGSGVLTLGGEGTSRLNLNGQTQTVAGLTTAANNTRQIVNLDATTTGSVAGTLVLDVADGDSLVFGSAAGVNSGDDRGNFNVVKNGLGTQQLGNLQIGGDVTVNAGTLEVGNSNGNSSIGNASVTGGTLAVLDTVTGSGTSYTIATGGLLRIGDGAIDGSINSVAAAGSIADVNFTNDGDIVFSRSDAVNYSGVIDGTGDLTVNGGGTFTLDNAQTYTGGTNINNGTLTAGTVNVISSDSVLSIGGADAGASVFDMNGLDQRAGGLDAVVGPQTRLVQNNGPNDATLTLDVAAGESFTYIANITGSSAVNIVKTGEGTQTFNRPSNYTADPGTITVNEGVLVWDSIESGDVTVQMNGTLAGGGIFAGDVTVDGGLSPGSVAGSDTAPLTFNNSLSLNSMATTNIEFASLSDFDSLVSTGTGGLTAGGTLNLTLVGYTPVEGNVFQVFSDWDSISGSFSSITGTDLGDGFMFDTSNLLTSGQLLVTATAVPEPASIVLLAIGLVAFTVRRRRTRGEVVCAI